MRSIEEMIAHRDEVRAELNELFGSPSPPASYKNAVRRLQNIIAEIEDRIDAAVAETEGQ